MSKPAARADEPAAPTAGSLADQVPPGWRDLLAGEIHSPSFARLEEFVAHERRTHTVYPPEEDVFNALRATPLDAVKVVLLGQDPYHDEGQAHGLAFSVRPGVRPPPSLVNIFRELHDDLGGRIPSNGCLTPWARQGVLLLNAVLTVRAHEANSHRDKGWEPFTDGVIRAVNARPTPAVFLLWGAHAQKKAALLDDRQVLLRAAHPSPLSVRKFRGSRPFSQANAALANLGQAPIDWQIPDREA
jgi:uracil-DNA glycosylase